MNSSERVMAAIQGKLSDQRAVALTLSLYGAKLINCPLEEYYSSAKAYAQGQQAVRELFKPDIMLAPFSFPLLGGPFGSEILFFENHPPNLIRPAIDDPNDIEQLEMPDIDSEPMLCYIRESLREMVSDAKGEYPVAPSALTPIDLPIMILGIETWLETVLFNHTLTQKILEFTSDFFLRWTNALFDDGAACIILPAPFANLRIVTRKFLTETAISNLNESFAQCKGPLIMHHGGVSYIDTLKYINCLPNTIGYCVGKEDDLAESREIIGSDSLLLGNIDGPSLHKRKPEDIYNQTSKIINSRIEDKHFILSSSAADIDLETPPENIHAIIQAVKDNSSETAGANA